MVLRSCLPAVQITETVASTACTAGGSTEEMKKMEEMEEI
jgi:hypothetical protein